jgi:hypothetical protein
MRYAKPTIVTLGAASLAIQGGAKTMAFPDAHPDTNPHPSSGNAYDLDE